MFPATYTGCNGIGSGLGSNVERGFDDMGILCVFCVYDTIGNRCFEKTSFPKSALFRNKNLDLSDFWHCLEENKYSKSHLAEDF